MLFEGSAAAPEPKLWTKFGLVPVVVGGPSRRRSQALADRLSFRRLPPCGRCLKARTALAERGLAEALFVELKL